MPAKTFLFTLPPFERRKRYSASLKTRRERFEARSRSAEKPALSGARIDARAAATDSFPRTTKGGLPFRSRKQRTVRRQAHGKTFPENLDHTTGGGDALAVEI